MSRAERLLALLQALRRRRRPVDGATLAAELGVSLRTLYRDVASLRAQGAAIDGEAGVGYLLQPGFLLPPLSFTAEELEALSFGARWVEQRGDPALSAAARDALAKIAAVAPKDLRDAFHHASLLVGPSAAPPLPPHHVDLSLLRDAIRRERPLALRYVDAQGRASERDVWPVALGYFDSVRVLAAWCALRQGFRHFRTDRILAATPGDRRYPVRRPVLLKAWREEIGLSTADKN